MSRRRIEYTEVRCADGVRRWLVRVWSDALGCWVEAGPFPFAERLAYVRRLRGGE